MSKIDNFGRILEVFSQADKNSDFYYPSYAIFNFAGLQGIPKSCFFCVFPQTAPRTTPKGIWGGTFDDFCRFLKILGSPWASLWELFSAFVSHLFLGLKNNHFHITFGRSRRQRRGLSKCSDSADSAGGVLAMHVWDHEPTIHSVWLKPVCIDQE